MSYKIGQVRKSDTTAYLSDLSWRASTVKTAGYAAKTFDDFAIQLTGGGSFNANYVYYLRFAIKRISSTDTRFADYQMTKDANDPREMNIKLELFKNNGVASNGEYERGTYQVIKNNITVQPYIEGENSPYYSFEIIFNPNASYEYLGLILSRTTYDYLGRTPRNDIATNVDLDERGDVATINNILPRPSVDKIGVQTRPGELICVNKEPIRVGRSGVYEVNNGVPVTFVGFVGPNGSDATQVGKFILDYAYDQT